MQTPPIFSPRYPVVSTNGSGLLKPTLKRQSRSVRNRRYIEMKHYKSLIVGGGMTAAAAVERIRTVDTAGSIGIISSDIDPPYDRPPLTKGLWKGQEEQSIWRKIENLTISLHLGRLVTQIDTQKKQATDSNKEMYSWDKLLLATGS